MEIQKLIRWYDKNKRDLPWRKTTDPYAILLSEIMLQQTRVEAVTARYLAFLDSAPDFHSLASLDEDKLLKLWEGLGYYSRAKKLQKAARTVQQKYCGKLPSSFEELLKLPGIGPYTAAAVSSIAFSQPVPAVDGNVLRVFTRLYSVTDDIRNEKTKKDIFSRLQSIIPAECPGKFNQAMMELGATICVPNGKPHCSLCPLSSDCSAHAAMHETDYPVKSPLRSRRIEKKTVFVLEHDSRYFGYKRGSAGLLANLYQLPDCPGYLSKEEILSFLEAHGLSVSGELRLYRRKHIFSHVEWHMQVLYARVSSSSDSLADDTWILLDPEKHSLPTAYKICIPETQK